MCRALLRISEFCRKDSHSVFFVRKIPTHGTKCKTSSYSVGIVLTNVGITPTLEGIIPTQYICHV